MKYKYLPLVKSTFVIFILFLSLVVPELIFAGTTGKISGKVLDGKTGEPLLGANIIIEGTTMGAATDAEGDYFIINVPPGKYSLKASMIGYTTQSMINIVVNIDRTTIADFKLEQGSISTNEVVVIAQRPVIRKDLTSSIVEINSKEIEVSPQRDVQSMLKQQRGVLLGYNKWGNKD